jgi:hypothetical protein
LSNNRFIIIFLLGISALFGGSQGVVTSEQVLEEFIWNHCFTPQKMSTQQVRTITQSRYKKLPLKPIVKITNNTQFWELNQQGKISMMYRTEKINDSITDTTARWNFYKNNQLTMIKKTGVAGIVVTSISYKNDLPIRFVYGKSKNKSSSKIKLEIDSYEEGRSEYLEHTTFGKKNLQTSFKSSDGVTFKVITTEIKDTNSEVISTQFPFQPNKDYVIEKTSELGQTKSLLVRNKTETSTQYEFFYDSLLIEINTQKPGYDLHTAHTELIYEEQTGLLKAIIQQNLQSKEIEIMKYHYTYYE